MRKPKMHTYGIIMVDNKIRVDRLDLHEGESWYGWLFGEIHCDEELAQIIKLKMQQAIDAYVVVNKITTN